MIRINLLRKSSQKRVRTTTVRIPWRIILVVVAVAALGGAGVAVWKFLPRTTKTAVAPPVVQTPPTSFTPSTHKTADIVEDVVREISEERVAGVRKNTSDMPYEDLSFLEKVNFEALYAKKVFEILSRAIPQGIGLKLLEVDNFQTVYAVGLGHTRELVSSAFLALKAEQLDLLPQPLSYITANGNDGYRFVVTCKTQFGLDFADPFQASDHLARRDDLPMLTKKITTVAEAAGVSFPNTPTSLDAEKTGAFRRFYYSYRGTANYSDFVKFLVGVHENRVPCAFKKITLKARTGTMVDIEALVIFTVRD
jgi:hypothetical protein